MLDLAYHDLRRDRGLYYQLQRNGTVHRVTRDLDIFAAKSIPVRSRLVTVISRDSPGSVPTGITAM